jgi:DNA-binding MarR family transcriptional regulator
VAVFLLPLPASRKRIATQSQIPVKSAQFGFIAGIVTCLRAPSRVGIDMAFNRMESATYLASLLARGFSRALQERGQKLGFAPGQFPVLLELWSEEGLTQRQLLDRLDIEQATMANTLARMERDGLIVRRKHPNDKRSQQIFLTERARKMEAAAKEAAAAAEQSLLSGFRRFEKELMLEYMRMALANTARHGDAS